MGTKADELRETNSCLNKTGTYEPVFILRANDPLAAMTIRHWATMAEGYHEQKKISEALNIAEAMDDWRRDRDAPKAACEPGGVIATKLPAKPDVPQRRA